MAPAKKRVDKSKAKKKKNKKVVNEAIIHIKTSFNNVLITVTDTKGDALFWASSGSIGYKGAKKSTPYAARLVASKITKEIVSFGIKKVEIKSKGIGSGKDSAIKQIQTAANEGNFEVVNIKNIISIPHNGVRKKKKYRRR